MTTSSTDPTRMTKRTCGVLTWRMYIYREVVFTKVVPNHLDSQYESSKWSSRLPYPPQIQSKFYFYEFQYYIKLKLYSLSCDKIFDTQHAWVLFVSLVVAGEWRATAGGRLVLTVVG